MPSSSPQNVLVVDDEQQVRQLTCRALSKAGFACDQASDGEEGFRMASGKHYEAVVTDLRMPKRNGHAFCTDLQKLPTPPHVMVLSAIYDARLTQNLRQMGVCEVIQKPVKYDVLATKVRNMVEHTEQPSIKRGVKPKQAVTAKVNLLYQIENLLSETTELYGERLDSVFDCHEELADPPKSVRDFIRRMAENELLGGDNGDSSTRGKAARVRDRVTCFTSVLAVPVDRNWRPNCQPFNLALRDLSESGIRMLHTRATNAEYLALRWNATQLVSKQLRVVAKVMRVRPLSPFYDIGCQFVMAD